MKKNGTKGQQMYLKVRQMRKRGLTVEEISTKTRLHKHTVEKYLRHEIGRHPSIPAGTRIRLPESAETMREAIEK